MTCFLAEVLDGQTVSEGEPLWWRDAKGAIPARWARQWDHKIGDQIAWSTERMKQVDHTAWRPPSTPGDRPVG